MKSKIGFVLFLIGGTGLEGEQMLTSAIMFLIGLFILWTESKKNRRTSRQANTSIKQHITMLFLYLL